MEESAIHGDAVQGPELLMESQQGGEYRGGRGALKPESHTEEVCRCLMDNLSLAITQIDTQHRIVTTNGARSGRLGEWGGETDRLALLSRVRKAGLPMP